MEFVAIPTNLAAALHSRLLADIREAGALAEALTNAQPCEMTEQPSADATQEKDPSNGN